MPDLDALLRKAKESPQNLRYTELCQLAEAYGFVYDRQHGSHQCYKNPAYKRTMTFQDDHGKAKRYRIKQLLDAIEELAAASEQVEDENGG